MSNIIEDAQAALTKLEKIQKSFEDENEFLKSILNENKNISEWLQLYNNDSMDKISECISKIEKSILLFRELNNKQDEVIDNVMLSLETKTRNNLRIAQENLDKLNLEISNYINDLQKVMIKGIKELFDTNFNNFEKLLESKKQEILDFSTEEKINSILKSQEQKISDLVERQNKRVRKYLFVVVLAEIIIFIISLIGLLK